MLSCKLWVISSQNLSERIYGKEVDGGGYQDLDVCFSSEVQDVERVNVWVRELVDSRGGHGCCRHNVMALDSVRPRMHEESDGLSANALRTVLGGQPEDSSQLEEVTWVVGIRGPVSRAEVSQLGMKQYSETYTPS